MKQCHTCLEWKKEEEFNWRYKDRVRHHICKECQKPFKRKWYHGSAKERHLENVKARKLRVREEAREYVYQYLSTHPCIQCGESDPVVLEFHHRGNKDKAVVVMVAGGYPISRIQAEIDKCDVLCANCHRRVTMKERGWFRGKR
jgi:hypothetical protein